MQEAVTGIRNKAYIYGIIAVILNSIVTAFFASMSISGSLFSGTTYGWDVNFVGKAAVYGYLPILVVSLIMGYTKRTRSLTKQEVVLIVTMMWVSWMIPTGYGITNFLLMLGTARSQPAYQKWTMQYGAPTNWLFGPDPNDAYLWTSWMSGGPVYWYMPQIVFGILWMVPWYLMFAFTSTLLRRFWIDIEDLPFPVATGASKIIDMAYEEEKGTPSILRNVYLYTGIIVGFLGSYPYWVPFILPALGVSRLQSPAWLGINLNAYIYSFLPRTNLALSVDAWLIGGMLLVPTGMLQSMLISWIIANAVLPTIFVRAGLWDPNTAPPTFYGSIAFRSFTGPIQRANWLPIFGNYGCWIVGTAFGLMVFPLWSFRHQLAESIKSIFAKDRTAAEKNEPLRFRYLIVGWILSFLWYAAVWYYGSNYNANFGAMLIMTLVSIFNVGVTWGRVSGEVGQWWSLGWHSNEGWFRGTVSSWIADPKSPFFMRDIQSRYLVNRLNFEEYGFVAQSAPTYTMLESFKMAALAGLQSKHVLLGGLIAMITATIVGMFVFTGIWQTFGAKNLQLFAYLGPPNNFPQRGPTYSCQEEAGTLYTRAYWVDWTYAGAQWTGFLSGAITTIVIYIVRARMPWFPISPAGWSMAFIFGDYAPLFLPILVAYVVKTLAARMGGLGFYERRLMPFAIGLVSGMTIVTIVDGLYEFNLALERIGI